MKNYFLQRDKAKTEKKLQLEQESKALELKEKKNKTIQKCVSNWKSTPGLLNDLKDEYQVEQMALILENQRLWEDIAGEHGLGELGIPLVHQIYKDFIGFEIVSVQTMLGPSDVHFNTKLVIDPTKEPGVDYDYTHKALYSQEIIAKTRKLKTYGDLTTENIPILAKSIKEEIEREIFTDLRNNAATIATLSNKDATGEELYVKLCEITSIIHRKTYFSLPKWLVTNKEIADRICSHIAEKNKPIEDGIYYWGVLNNCWKIIIDPLFPANQILMGQYDHYNTGYTYCPYVPLTTTPRIIDPEFMPRPGFLVRYGKRLEKTGAKYYARIKIGAE